MGNPHPPLTSKIIFLRFPQKKFSLLCTGHQIYNLQMNIAANIFLNFKLRSLYRAIYSVGFGRRLEING